MTYFKRIKSLFVIDIRDVFFFAGLAMLGYGLYLRFGLWLALVVCGPLLTATGYLMRDKPRDRQ